MRNEVRQRLQPVRIRQRLLSSLHSATSGLFAGAVLAILLGVSRWAGAPIETSLIFTVLLTGLLLGALYGLLRRSTWTSAAVAIDQHYGLKDRALTALAFETRPG